jgi:hypothetical protein
MSTQELGCHLTSAGRSKGATCMVNTDSTARSEDRSKATAAYGAAEADVFHARSTVGPRQFCFETPVDTFPQGYRERELQLWIVSCYSSHDPYHFAKILGL